MFHIITIKKSSYFTSNDRKTESLVTSSLFKEHQSEKANLLTPESCSQVSLNPEIKELSIVSFSSSEATIYGYAKERLDLV